MRHSRRRSLTNTVPGALVFAAIIAAVFALPAQAQQSPEQRAAAIVTKMTLEEKASQLIDTAPGIPRLKVPDYQWWSEALHGYAFLPHATNFPEPTGLAASFDTPLVKQVAEAIATEGIEASDDMVRAGRSLELGAGRTYWSPNLTGLQGPNPDKPVIVATPKHFAVHSGPESTRHTADVTASLHDRRDTYLPAFRAAVVEVRAGWVMCADSSINGQPACTNTFLMRETLRDAWNFKGTVVSDCGAVRDISSAHKYAADLVAGSALAVRAGMNVECATESLFDRNSFGQSLDYVNAVKTGKLSVAELDKAVAQGLAQRIRLGLFDAGPAPAPKPTTINSAAHRALALTAADRSMVLLKNDGALPLATTSGLKVAMIGPLADSRRVLRGNYTNRETADLPSVLDGLKAALPGARITYVPAGASITDGDIVPTSALQTAGGKPGVTVSYFPLKPDGKPAATSLMAKFTHAIVTSVADAPLRRTHAKLRTVHATTAARRWPGRRQGLPRCAGNRW